MVRTRCLRENIRADVVIVGAGISGAFMAHALTRQMAHVVVLDRRLPTTGSTAASTALLQFEIDVPLIQLQEKIDGTRADRAWLRSYQATQELVQLVRSEQISCGLERRGSMYLAGGELGSRALRRECEARNRVGLPGEFLNQHQLRDRFKIQRTGAILSPNSAVANPRRLAAGLLRRSIERGARIYSPAPVDGVWSSESGVVVASGRNFVESRYCVFCTGYELLKGLPTRGLKITSSWAIASAPATDYPSWLDQFVIWEASKPYLYMRTTSDGRVIVGGEDENVDLAGYRSRSLGRKGNILRRKAECLVPNLQMRPTLRWSGAFGESDDGLPTIDLVPNMPNCYVAMGFGGNGTIYSFIASQIVSKLLDGSRDADRDLYQFRN